MSTLIALFRFMAMKGEPQNQKEKRSPQQQPVKDKITSTRK